MSDGAIAGRTRSGSAATAQAAADAASSAGISAAETAAAPGTHAQQAAGPPRSGSNTPALRHGQEQVELVAALRLQLKAAETELAKYRSTPGSGPGSAPRAGSLEVSSDGSSAAPTMAARVAALEASLVELGHGDPQPVLPPDPMVPTKVSTEVKLLHRTSLGGSPKNTHLSVEEIKELLLFLRNFAELLDGCAPKSWYYSIDGTNERPVGSSKDKQTFAPALILSRYVPPLAEKAGEAEKPEIRYIRGLYGYLAVHGRPLKEEMQDVKSYETFLDLSHEGEVDIAMGERALLEVYKSVTTAYYSSRRNDRELMDGRKLVVNGFLSRIPREVTLRAKLACNFLGSDFPEHLTLDDVLKAAQAAYRTLCKAETLLNNVAIRNQLFPKKGNAEKAEPKPPRVDKVTAPKGRPNPSPAVMAIDAVVVEPEPQVMVLATRGRAAPANPDNRGNAAAAPAVKLRCYNCQELDHTIANCPEKVCAFGARCRLGEACPRAASHPPPRPPKTK
jgi:hypothetical protein